MKQSWIYWLSTGVFSLWMLKNAYDYLFSEQAAQYCHHFGFPDYFRIELAVAKILGVIILLYYKKLTLIKEWAYAGFAIVLISGFIAHLASNDGVKSVLSIPIASLFLALSYFTYHRQIIKSK